MNYPLRGSLFETFIVAELVKSRFNHGKLADLFFWRDSNGNEVDIIAEQGTKLMPLEIKSGKTLSIESTKGLKKYISIARNSVVVPTLIYNCDDSFKQQDMQITSWRECGDILLKQINSS